MARYAISWGFKPLIFMIFALVLTALAPMSQARAEIATLEEAMSLKVLGDPAAPVEMNEYASLTCSHCANFHNDVLPQIKRDYIDTGKVKLVYRDFPLDDLALAASMLARCSGNDNFFPMIGTLFKSQENWARAENPLQALNGISRMIGGMSEDDVQACLKQNDLFWFLSDGRTTAGERLGIKSTPSFVINGTMVPGALPYEDFKDIFEKALASKR